VSRLRHPVESETPDGRFDGPSAPASLGPTKNRLFRSLQLLDRREMFGQIRSNEK
jgi:hypothetical protein